ncbi:hypothetical protein GOBAR_AA29702 [Gossypium barbadense]|uniref:Uncharacterized protein n=1 Tax=Gossypium barbadense TaxID=3634 RepID=A0A2P5WIP8_GOSBA|nr:hypothetical protein GOBAR_AA29702 [Gossypium barbadense]
MELEDDDDLGTMIAIYCPPKIENPNPIELFAESDNDDQSHRDPNDDFSDPDLDDIPKDIDEERPVEGENANPYSAGNTGPGIVIRNNLGSFMTDVDPDAAFSPEFPEYTNIVPAHLLYEGFGDEELFVGQQFDNKRDCLHAIKQLSLKLADADVNDKETGRSTHMHVRSFIARPWKVRSKNYMQLHHTFACARANLNVELFIDEIYTLERTLCIWGNEFPVMPDVSNLEVPPPAFEMVPDRSLRRNPKGRPQSTRIRNDMDVRETSEPKLCTVCRTSGHNRSTCPHRVYVSGQSSRNTGLQDDE